MDCITFKHLEVDYKVEAGLNSIDLYKKIDGDFILITYTPCDNPSEIHLVGATRIFQDMVYSGEI